MNCVFIFFLVTVILSRLPCLNVSTCKKKKKHAQAWRRFPLQKDRGRFVIKGFHTCIREQFTEPGTAIYYQQFEWNAGSAQLGGLPRKGLRRHQLEDHLSHVPSLRRVQGLSLDAELNIGNNEVQAFAGSFEALANRANWLGMLLETNSFGRAMLAAGCDHDQGGVR